MTGFHQVLIGGYPSGGLTQDRKPALLSNEAFSDLENAYVFRERTKKRDGEVPMGRLSRLFSAASLGNSGASPWTFNIFTLLSIIEPNAEIQPGSVSISIVGVATPFLDAGNGLLTNLTAGNSGVINYITGVVTLITTATAGSAAIITFAYFPALPVMGILRREVSTIGIDSTVFFDTTYAYQYINGFQELVPGETWTGNNTDFFWAANFQGASADLRYFFVTNNNILLSGPGSPSYDPIRYYNNSTWIDLQPLLTATITLWQAEILIPYYGRLLALNTWEGLTSSTFTGATNFFARCRFSQLGDPTDQTNGWRSDIFGRGGFIDAPTNESIVGAAFFRNTLIVFFEYSTWQLRYIGEYGLPFIFERISSDFGAVSTFSPIVFDQGVMAVSDRGIIQAAANGVTRLDDQIPEQVFSFQIQNNAPNFVHGIRDFEKELVYWNYLDTSNQSTNQSFPNTVLVFNYKNNTWAKFRDNITCFGPTQFQFGITWDSLTTLWESNVSWDNVDDQQYVDYITAGTPNGFINIYNNPDAETPQPVSTLYAPSMAITAVNFTVSPNQVTIPNHNLANGEIIYIQGTIWSGTDPGLNNMIYAVTIIDANTVTLSRWDFPFQNYVAINITSTAVYLGGGRVTLFPKMNIVGKDYNPFQGAGKQFKLSFIDFQMDSNLISPAIAAITVQLFVNSYLGEQANLIASNQELINSSQNCGFITNAFQTNPCQVTSPDHSLITGTLIYIANVQGMIQLNSAIYSITVVDANNFTLDNTDATGFSAYITGGIWNTSPVNGQTYIPGSEYAWYRFYSTQFGQYLRIGLTYDDNLMNQLATHQTPMELNAMNIWFREGGRIIN
jgi:Ubiquitin-activating enzyme E1 FCCH domain